MLNLWGIESRGMRKRRCWTAYCRYRVMTVKTAEMEWWPWGGHSFSVCLWAVLRKHQPATPKYLSNRSCVINCVSLPKCKSVSFFQVGKCQSNGIQGWWPRVSKASTLLGLVSLLFTGRQPIYGIVALLSWEMCSSAHSRGPSCLLGRLFSYLAVVCLLTLLTSCFS